MIPKVIHYCWFGGNPLNKLGEKCLKSWKHFCPDYEIIRWDEQSFNLDEAPLYVKQAYQAKKWAFVSDYVRLYALVNYGGVYMDTDVELLKPIDRFLVHRSFSGFEDDTHIPTGIMASEKQLPLFTKLLSYYDDAQFYNKDGSLNLTTNVQVITSILTKHGFIPNGEFQEVLDFALYPKDYFCPVDYETNKLLKTRNTVCIHWYAGSWVPDEEKKKREKKLKEQRIDQIIHIPNQIGRKLLGDRRYENVKRVIKNKQD